MTQPATPPLHGRREWAPEPVTRDYRLTVVREADGSMPAGDLLPVALSSEYPVLRTDWWTGEQYYEVLDHAAGSVDMSRAVNGLPCLLDHERSARVGRYLNVRLEDARLRGDLKLSRTADGVAARQDIEDEILVDVSVGYRLFDEYVETKGPGDALPTRRYTRWQPMEASLVTIPADPTVGIGRSAPHAASAPASPRAPENPTMNDLTTPAAGGTAPAAAPDIRVLQDQAQSTERERAATIQRLAGEHGCQDRAEAWIRGGASVHDVTAQINAILSERLRTPIQHGGPSIDGLSPKEARRYSYAKALLLNERDSGLDATFEREVHDELFRKLTKQNIPVKSGVLVPTRLTATDEVRAGLEAKTGTLGGNAVLQQAGEFIDLLRNRLALGQLGATFLTGLTGPITMLKQSASASASWVGENPGTDVADSNLLYNTVTLSVKTLQASTSFSRQLLAQAVANWDVEQTVRNDLVRIFALAIDAAGITGSGSANQPLGLLNNTVIGSVTMGANGAAITYDKIVDLMSAPADANADIGSQAFLTNTRQRGQLLKTPVLGNTVSGTPIWQPGQSPNGSVLAFPAVISNQVPRNLTKGTSTTICSPILFGAWEHLFIADWGALELITDPYRLKKQGMIEVTGIQMADVAVRYAEAFAAIKDAL